MEPAEFAKQRRKFLAELERVYATARALEDALGLPSRIRPPGADPASPRPPKARRAPHEGSTSRRIWDLLKEQPGLDQQGIRTALQLRKETTATAVHSMLKYGQLRTEGRRTAYRYFAVVR